MSDNTEDSFVGIIHSYLYRIGKLKVEILSGEIAIGMYAKTSGCTAECDMSGKIEDICRSGDGKNESIERVVAGDIVYVSGLGSPEPKGMYRGAYIISNNVSLQKHKYMVVNTTKTPFQTMRDVYSQYIRFTGMPDIPGIITKRGQKFFTNATVPAKIS